MYHPAPNIELLDIFKAIFCRAKNLSDQGSGFLWFYRSSFALYVIGVYLRTSNPRTTFLLPEYICNEVPEIIRLSGCRIQYYKINSAFEPDYEWLDANIKLSPATVFVLVHFFGKISDTEKALAYCDAQGGSLFEDCSHTSVLYKANPRTRFSAFSPYKIEPIPDGGILYCRDAEDRESILRFHERLARKWRAGSVASWFVKKIILKLAPAFIFKRMNKRIVTDFNDQNAEHLSLKDLRKPTCFSWKLFNIIDKNKHLDLRKIRYIALRSIFTQWLQSKHPDSFEIVENGKYPYSLVLTFHAPEIAASVYVEIRSFGIPALSWPNLPLEIIERGGDAFRLRNQVVLIPLHQSIPEHNIAKIGRLLNG